MKVVIPHAPWRYEFLTCYAIVKPMLKSIQKMVISPMSQKNFDIIHFISCFGEISGYMLRHLSFEKAKHGFLVRVKMWNCVAIACHKMCDTFSSSRNTIDPPRRFSIHGIHRSIHCSIKHSMALTPHCTTKNNFYRLLNATVLNKNWAETQI